MLTYEAEFKLALVVWAIFQIDKEGRDSSRMLKSGPNRATKEAQMSEVERRGFLEFWRHS